MTKSELNIYQRKDEVIKEIGGALEKTKQVDKKAGGFFFHSIDDVHDAIRFAFLKHGISFYHTLVESRQITQTNKYNEPQNFNEKIVKCVLVNVDDPTETIESVESAYGSTSTDKGPGIASSYAIKTCLVNMLHLKGQKDLEELGEHDDIPRVQGVELNKLTDLMLLISDLEPGAESRFLKKMRSSSIEAIKASEYPKACELLEKKLDSLRRDVSE